MTITIKDTLKDILRHTHGLGIFDMVKITGTKEETVVETTDADKTVIFKGKTNTPVKEFVDATVGLSRMSVLNGYLQYQGFEEEGSSVGIVTQERNGETVPVEVKFEANEGTDAVYRFMLADVINQQLKEIKFRGAEFDIDIVPTAKNIKDLMYFNGILGAFESNFSPRVVDKKLYFHIGDGVSDRTKILIAEGITVKINADLRWPLDIVLKILKLSESSTALLSINSKGLLQIKVDSGLAEYTYLLPSKG
jgi:hypothetical protein